MNHLKPFDRCLVKDFNNVWYPDIFLFFDGKECKTTSGWYSSEDICPYDESKINLVEEHKRASLGSKYYTIQTNNNGEFEIITKLESNNQVDDVIFKSDNYFKSKEEAEVQLIKLKEIFKNR